MSGLQPIYIAPVLSVYQIILACERRISNNRIKSTDLLSTFIHPEYLGELHVPVKRMNSLGPGLQLCDGSVDFSIHRDIAILFEIFGKCAAEMGPQILASLWFVFSEKRSNNCIPNLPRKAQIVLDLFHLLG